MIPYLECLVDDRIEFCKLRVDWLLDFLRKCPPDIEVQGLRLIALGPRPDPNKQSLPRDQILARIWKQESK